MLLRLILRGRPPILRRDIGMDDWEGSLGTSLPSRLWPLRGGLPEPSARPAATALPNTPSERYSP